jgi:small subunit ribosomal protein S6
MNNRYEAVVVFDPALGDSEITQQIEKIEAVVKAHGGAIEKQDLWGRRDLAYRINKKSQGFYAVLVISGDNSLVADLRRQLRINDAVLRSLIVDKDRYAPDAVRPSTNEGHSYRESRAGSEAEISGELESEEAAV